MNERKVFAINSAIKYPELPPEYLWMKECSDSQKRPEVQAWIQETKARAKAQMA